MRVLLPEGIKWWAKFNLQILSVHFFPDNLLVLHLLLIVKVATHLKVHKLNEYLGINNISKTDTEREYYKKINHSDNARPSRNITKTSEK